MKERKDKLLNLILPLISVLVIFALWVVMAKSIGNEYILPSVADTFSALIGLLKEQSFYIALLGTLGRSLIAFIISFVLAFILAVLSITFKYFERAIAPVISFLRALPTIAVVLLLLFWTNSKVAPVIVTLLVVLPTCYTYIKTAFESVDKTTVEAGLVDGASKRKAFFNVMLPQALPAVYSAVGSGFSLNLKLMVAAEVLSATANSLGYMLNVSKVYFEIATMIALVVITVIIGCVIEFIFNALSKKAGKWK